MNPASYLDRPMTVLVVDDEHLSRQRLRRLLDHEPDVHTVGECAGGLDALNAITHHRPELVFLDVQMPDLTGVEVVEMLDEATCPEVVFVTAYDQYLQRAFELHALDFLRKPFTNERFASALAHARRRVAARRAVVSETPDVRAAMRRRAATEIGAAHPRGRIAIQERTSAPWHLLDADTITAVEADAGVAVHVHVGATTYTWACTLEAAQRTLVPYGFVRAHRQWIVNPSHVRQIMGLQKGEYELVLPGGTTIATGRRYRAEVEQAFGLRAA